MPASAALPETLKAITATKIEELSKQRHNYESSKRRIVNDAAAKTDLLSKVNAVVNGSCRLQGYTFIDEATDYDPKYEDLTLSGDLINKKRFLRQAQMDPSFSKTVLRNLGEEVTRDLELKSTSHMHAEFFSRLVTQWLAESDGAEEKQAGNAGESLDSSSTFEDVGRKEMHEQRAQWESLVFQEHRTSEDAIENYLHKLFTSTKASTHALETLCRDIRRFCTTLETGIFRFDAEFLRATIKGLIQTDLLSNEKVSILKQFSNNKEVTSEICDVLNMRVASLSTWSWTVGETGAIPLEMRRQLNGKYRVYMDEDVLDALFQHGIGLRLAVTFKEVFTDFFNSQAWLRGNRPMPKSDKERREYYLAKPTSLGSNNVHSLRRTQFAKDYFMTQLPSEVSEGARAYDSDDDDHDRAVRKGPLETKHSLLHLLVAESLIARRLHGDFTVIRSDFKWFGPSLPHSTIFATLRFFGISETIIGFFKRFLQAPVRFIDDGPGGEVRTRARGVPMSHTLSDVFGEVVLFCMDYAVNQKTSGSYLYRLHDDFWLWGQEKVCRDAWASMKEFTVIMGMQFNEEKTGTVRFGSTQSKSNSKDPLPKGDVRWGFLYLDPKEGRFLIDRDQVDTHIGELRTQLSHCKSVFSYVQAYNAYLARFFTNNFGKPSLGFGRAHIEMMIDSFARIQRSLFPEGNVTDYLKKRIEEEFQVKDLLDGFFYFPNRMGGLELRNPFIQLLGMRDSCTKTPEKMLELALDHDEVSYQAAKAAFTQEDSSVALKASLIYSRDLVGRNESFMTLEEYLRYREETSGHLADVYRDLLQVPAEKGVVQTDQIAGWMEGLQGTSKRRRTGMHLERDRKRRRLSNTIVSGRNRSTKVNHGIGGDWDSMQPYWKWVLAVNGAEVVRKYGGLQLVEEGKVPIGVVEMLKQGRVRWRG